MTNYFDLDVRNQLASALTSGLLKIDEDSNRYFDMLSERYPADGSKIAWQAVPGSLTAEEPDPILQTSRFLDFLDGIVSSKLLAGDATYVGDSSTELAIIGSIAELRKVLPTLLEIPQHHYLVGPSGQWVVCFTMEGGMGFGFAPSGSAT